MNYNLHPTCPEVREVQSAGRTYRVEPTDYYGQPAVMIRDLEPKSLGLTVTVFKDEWITHLPGVQITGNREWLAFQQEVSLIVQVANDEKQLLSDALGSVPYVW